MSEDSGAMDLNDEDKPADDNIEQRPAPAGTLGLDERLSLSAQVEAILFATPKPMQPGEIMEVLQDEDYSAKQVTDAIEHLKTYYAERNGGIILNYLRGSGYQMQTVDNASYLMERMFAKKPRPLSRPAQETLAIIAYRQPVTRADIEYIRGVDAGSIIKNLLEKELICCTGRKDEVGRPMMFGTTEEFLRTYRIRALSELPPLEAFQPKVGEIRAALSSIAEKDEDKGEIDI
jgi:segregation and condensation protein B